MARPWGLPNLPTDRNRPREQPTLSRDAGSYSPSGFTRYEHGVASILSLSRGKAKAVMLNDTEKRFQGAFRYNMQ